MRLALAGLPASQGCRRDSLQARGDARRGRAPRGPGPEAAPRDGGLAAAARARGALRARGGTRHGRWWPPRTGQEPRPEVALGAGAGSYRAPDGRHCPSCSRRGAGGHHAPGQAPQPRGGARREQALRPPRWCSARALAAATHRGRHHGPKWCSARASSTARGGARHGRWRPPRTGQAPRPRGGARRGRWRPPRTEASTTAPRWPRSSTPLSRRRAYAVRTPATTCGALRSPPSRTRNRHAPEEPGRMAAPAGHPRSGQRSAGTGHGEHLPRAHSSGRTRRSPSG